MLALAISVLLGSATYYDHEVKGTVYDAKSGHPMAGVQVIIESYIERWSATTDENGGYAFSFTSVSRDPNVDLRTEGWGLRPFSLSGRLSQVRKDLYPEPKVVCAKSASTYADIDCVSVREIAQVMQVSGAPMSDDTIGLAIDDLSNKYHADGLRDLLVMSPDGPESVATPTLMSASSSLSVGPYHVPVALYQYKAALEDVVKLKEEIGGSGIDISITCPDIPGSDWEERSYYGRHDNTWCSYMSSEGQCTSCCDSRMTTCTAAVAAVAAAVASSCGPWCVVAAVVGGAVGGGTCLYYARKCTRGCRQRFSCCVDTFGNVIQDGLHMDHVTNELRKWQQSDTVTGRVNYNSCKKKYMLIGKKVGQNVLTMPLSGPESMLSKFRLNSGNFADLRGLFDLNEGSYMVTDVEFITFNSVAPNAVAICGVAP